MKTLKINEILHKELKDFCDKNSLKMNSWVETIIRDYLKNINKKDDNR